METLNRRLLDAAKSNELKAVKKCLDNADVNCKDEYGWTPLHWAAVNGSKEITGLLIEHGANVNIQTQIGRTPLHYAAQYDFSDIAVLLIIYQANVDLQDHDEKTPLYLAVNEHKTNTAGLLINHMANVDLRDNCGQTPLHRAALNGYTDITGLLINHEATLNLRDNKGRTPYDLAKKDEIKTLLEAAQDKINAGLPRELFQLGKQSASVFTDLLKKESFELFELRSMLHGERGTGKSTIARFLVGKGPTKIRMSTNGIDLYTGLSFFDNDTEEWIEGKQEFTIEDITVSRSLKSFRYKRIPSMQSEQTNLVMSAPKEISSPLLNENTKNIFEKQDKATLLLEKTNNDVPNKQRLENREDNVEMSKTEAIKRVLGNATYREMIENRVMPSQKWLDMESFLVPENTGLAMYESEKVKYTMLDEKQKGIDEQKDDVPFHMEKTMCISTVQDLMRHSIYEEMTSNVDLPKVKQESMMEHQCLMGYSKDEEVSSNIEISQHKQEAMIKKQVLMHHAKDEGLASNIDIPQPKDGAMMKQGVTRQLIQEEMALNIDLPQPGHEAVRKQQGLLQYPGYEELVSYADTTHQKQEAIMKQEGLNYHSTDEELASNIDITHQNDEAMIKQQGLTLNLIDEELTSNIDTTQTEDEDMIKQQGLTLNLIEECVSNEDLPQPLQEAMIKQQGIFHCSNDEELVSNIETSHPKQEAKMKQKDLKYHSIDDELASNIDINQPNDDAMKKHQGLTLYSTDKEFESNTDIPQAEQEAMIKREGLMQHSIDEELASNVETLHPKQGTMVKHEGLKYHSINEVLASNIDITHQEDEAMMKKQGLTLHTIDDKALASNIEKTNDKQTHILSHDNTGLEIIRDTGFIKKLKAFFGVKKKNVAEVKVSVTKTAFFEKSRVIAKTKFHKRNLVPVTIWDFGGQDVFYSTHQTFLTYRAVYMLVLDGSRTMHGPCDVEQFLPGKTGFKTQKDYVRFWINTIITYCKGDIPGFPKIMVILTHKDKLKVTDIDARRSEIFSEIERMFDGSPIQQHLAIEDRIFVNALNRKDPEMKQLKKSLIRQARIQPTWGQKLPKCFLLLELEIQHRVKAGVKLIHIEVIKKINSQHPVRPLTDPELKVFLKFQHAVGKILFFDEKYLNNHIIICPTYLIDAFKSIITDHEFCKGNKQKEEAWYGMDRKGIILKQTIQNIWKQKKFAHFLESMEYLLGVMTHLDILVEPLRYDSTHVRTKQTEFYYVASMVRKQDTTGFLQSPTFSKRNIAIRFDMARSIIPPALSFRFISYCLSIWGVKTYADDTEDMLFHRSAAFTIDPSLDVHIQCEDEQLIVRLVHKTDRTFIMKDLASSIQECLYAALQKISLLYIKTSSERTENIRSFDVKVCCSSSTEPCFIAVEDIGDIWTCSRHHIEHPKDLVLSWFSEKGKESCEYSCPVTDENFLLQTPTDLHLRRLSIEYNMTEVRVLVIALGLPYNMWDELYTSTLTDESIRFTAFKRCGEKTLFTFKDLKIAAEKEDIQNPHTICKVVRDRHICFDTEPEKWDLTVTDEDIDKLAPVVGNRSLGFLVELGLTFHDWEQIEYSQRERDLVKLNRAVMEAWRNNCKSCNIKPALRTIGQAFGNIGINSKLIPNILFN